MTVRIREADYVTADGTTYPVRADLVRGHLMVIASGGTMDLEPSFGDTPDPADPAYSIVQYDPEPQDLATNVGKVRQRLKDLVDEGDNNRIVGVDGHTIWSDGTTVETTPAYALGDTLFYDTSNSNGAGRWIIGINGNQECTNPTVILFHELAHSFRNHGLGTVADEEREAIEDENWLREALGLVPRDPERRDGGAGCPDDGCCIVATVACGSPYAPSVNRLRRLRDDVLRRSPLGARFFDELFREYYAFSVEIARILVRDAQARAQVEQWLVRPLVGILEVMQGYRLAPDDVKGLGGNLLALLRESPAATPDQAHAACRLLEALAAGATTDEVAHDNEATRRIRTLLASWLPRSPQVDWGILGPLRIHGAASARFADSTDAEAAGRWLAARIDAWLRSLPLRALGELSPELIDEFAASLFAEEEARRALSRAWRERHAHREKSFTPCESGRLP
ncbi:CFI-box-CTERM domain-containing protein [Geoalkalibacter sp.]|uniref:CFI-box-CTERM domain-containing protein n=1 Tax=Geoalkalibacter sp. TaxID=3041440 RepID=UPI00272E1C07|nr:CFI-box-CTERM domain-containing protein [Geoalkalibacter sp.]